jgi:hypothetical protein
VGFDFGYCCEDAKAGSFDRILHPCLYMNARKDAKSQRLVLD